MEKKKGALRRRDKVWRRAGEELITHRQAGEQQTDAARAQPSSVRPGWREERERLGWSERKEEGKELCKN